MSGTSNWDIFSAVQAVVGSTLPSFGVDTVNPMVGTASGSYTHPDSPGVACINTCVTTASGFPKGVTTGRFRTLVKTVTNNYGEIANCGFVFMQSTPNIVTGSVSFYYALLVLKDVGGPLSSATSFAYLGKTTSSNLLTALLPGVPLGQLFTGFPDPAIRKVSNSDVTFAMEIEWDYDLINLQGVGMVFRFGLMTDFSDLTDVVTYVDTASPLSTSTAESLIFSDVSGGVGGIRLDVDTTSLFIP